MVIAALTGLINPAGDGAYTYLYKTMQGNTTNSINEHQPLVLIDSDEFLFTICLQFEQIAFTAKAQLSGSQVSFFPLLKP